MAILDVGSTNPNFSFIISKNPATIRDSKKAYRREVRKGVAYGWFIGSDDKSFRLWFKDADNESSFAEGRSEEFEYLDRSRYGSPYIPIALISNCLASAARNPHEDDLPEETVTGLGKVHFKAFVRTVIKVPNVRYLDQMLSHYLPLGVEISFSLVQGRYYQVVVEASTVFNALNVMQVVCILQCLCDPETYVPMDTEAAKKFVKVFNRANAPYYPRYLFQMKAISNHAMFNKLKDDLSAYGMNLKYGDTRQQRLDAIRQELTGGQRLVDIGCGEMFQAIKLCGKYETVYAVEADEDRHNNNNGKVEGRKLENIIPLHAEANVDWIKDNAPLLDEADVLITEVLEHIEFQAGDELLTQMLIQTNPNKVVVTCPNKDFNQFYALEEDEMRHPDHKFEPTFEEFCDWMVTIAAAGDYDVVCKGIGDSVDGISTSTMAVFTKKTEEQK